MKRAKKKGQIEVDNNYGFLPISLCIASAFSFNFFFFLLELLYVDKTEIKKTKAEYLCLKLEKENSVEHLSLAILREVQSDLMTENCSTHLSLLSYRICSMYDANVSCQHDHIQFLFLSFFFFFRLHCGTIADTK